MSKVFYPFWYHGHIYEPEMEYSNRFAKDCTYWLNGSKSSGGLLKQRYHYNNSKLSGYILDVTDQSLSVQYSQQA